MCQLAAYVGDRPAAHLLLESLGLQEGYAGGQATGMATLGEGGIGLVKRPGPVEHVKANSGIASLKGNTGIAHSRYSLSVFKGPEYNLEGNAHPWTTAEGKAALMHNGVINNYKDHWEALMKTYEFTSYSPKVDDITDSEVAVHLLDTRLKEGKGMREALRETANSLTGMVLLAAISTEEPEAVHIANWVQACTIGKGDGETIFSSSRLGLAHVWDDFDVFTAPRNSLIKLTRDCVEISKLDPKRTALDPRLDEGILLEESLRVLRKRGEMDTISLLRSLAKDGFEKVFGLEKGAWMKFYGMGWGDQNQVMEPLAWMAEKGLIGRIVRPRVEGGATVPRVLWSAP